MPGKVREDAAGTGLAFSSIFVRSKSDRVWQATNRERAKRITTVGGLFGRPRAC